MLSKLLRKKKHDLFLYEWKIKKQDSLATVLILHGYMDHAGRYKELADYFNKHSINAFGLDLRGHGKSSGRRGYIKKYSDYHEDISTTLKKLPTKNLFILGHSHGGLLALDFFHSDKNISGIILSNPYLKLAIPTPKLKLFLVQSIGRFFPFISLASPLKKERQTHDQNKIDEHNKDPLGFNSINIGWFLKTLEIQKKVCLFKSIQSPLFFGYSDKDTISCSHMNHIFSKNIQTPNKKIKLCRGQFHKILDEIEREVLYKEIVDFILLNRTSI